MKRIFTLILSLGLASMVVAQIPPKGEKKGKKNRNGERQGGKRGGPNGGKRGGQPNAVQANPAPANAAPQNAVQSDNQQGNVGQDNDGQRNRRGGNRRGRDRDQTNRNLKNAASLLNAVLAPANADVEVRRDRGRGRGRGRQSGNRNRNITRRGPSEFSWSFSEARRRHHRGDRRNRSYYRDNYNRFALFAGGYYYFDRGYWYPAYGYDSAYSNYQFDEPIYGYNNLEPGRVIINVQKELREQGYYDSSIDGLIGPATRSALGEYQRDIGLEVTRSIDGPTLAALGLT